MRYKEEANKVVVCAEASLRTLAEQALEARAYAEVAHIASLADALRGVAERSEATVDSAPAAVNVASLRSELPVRRAKRSLKSPARARRGYPRFERDGDKLVKIGWSKKSREEYEHRAPRAAVEAFTQFLASKVPTGEKFLIEDLLPVGNGADGELPSYQVYLTLAWLRELGAVKKVGREGYILQKDTVNGGLDELWEQTEARRL